MQINCYNQISWAVLAFSKVNLVFIQLLKVC